MPGAAGEMYRRTLCTTARKRGMPALAAVILGLLLAGATGPAAKRFMEFATIFTAVLLAQVAMRLLFHRRAGKARG